MTRAMATISFCGSPWKVSHNIRKDYANMATAIAPAPPPNFRRRRPDGFVVDRNQLLTEVAAARGLDTKSTQPLLTHFCCAHEWWRSLNHRTDLQRTVTTECPAAIKTLARPPYPHRSC